MRDVLADLRYALRALRNAPGLGCIPPALVLVAAAMFIQVLP